MTTATLSDYLHQVLVTHLIAKNIFCPHSGVVLDERTCVIVNDAGGDPVAVFAPEGWAMITEDQRTALANGGYTVDERTTP